MDLKDATNKKRPKLMDRILNTESKNPALFNGFARCPIQRREKYIFVTCISSLALKIEAIMQVDDCTIN